MEQDQAKSRHVVSGALTYTFTAESDGFVSVVRANTPVHDRVRFDGKDYPASAAPNQTVSWRRVSDALLESTIKRDGVLLASARWIVSADGKRLTQETTPVRANGDNDVNVIEYVRSSGEPNTIFGVWTPVSSRTLVPDMFTFTLVDGELRAFYPKYGYVVYTMRLDGRPHPLTAPNNAGAEASSASESVDTRTIRRTTYQHGRPTLQVVLHLSDDGNEMTVTTSTPGSASSASIDVYEKQTPTHGRPPGFTRPPIVTATDAPAGTEGFPVKWVTLAVPDLGVLRAAIARPAGTGPFPAVVVLHGTHGFAREYVEWANDLARGGFVAVAGCWFSGGGGAGASAVTRPIPCPDIPPLTSDDYPQAVQFVDALVKATRSLPGVRADRLALVGHSRGAGEATLKYLLANGNVQAAVLHSSGYALRPWRRAAEFNVPILLMHGTADDNGPNTEFRFAREFETALRANNKSVETAYCQGCGHNTFFTNSAQRENELKRMTEFLRHHLGG